MEHTTGRSALRALGAKQVDIAARVEVTQQAVSDWITGRAIPGASSRTKLAVHYGIPVALWAADERARDAACATDGTPDPEAA